MLELHCTSIEAAIAIDPRLKEKDSGIVVLFHFLFGAIQSALTVR